MPSRIIAEVTPLPAAPIDQEIAVRASPYQWRYALRVGVVDLADDALGDSLLVDR